MTTSLKTLLLCLLAVTGLAACRPAYVHESYYEGYGPGYAPVVAYEPIYVPRPVVVTKVIVRPPRRDYIHTHVHRQPGHCDKRFGNCWRNRHD